MPPQSAPRPTEPAPRPIQAAPKVPAEDILFPPGRNNRPDKVFDYLTPGRIHHLVNPGYIPYFGKFSLFAFVRYSDC